MNCLVGLLLGCVCVSLCICLLRSCVHVLCVDTSELDALFVKLSCSIDVSLPHD